MPGPGWNLRPPIMLYNLQREAEALLRHYQRAGELTEQACDIADDPSTMLDHFKGAGMQSAAANGQLGPLVEKAKKFLRQTGG